jgi:hypothetical protein
MAKVVAALALVAVPEMTPVEPSNEKPGGNPGLTAYRSIGPDTLGVNAMASPTTAGKGCDPLYDNAGGDGVVESPPPPPQPASQDRPTSTPTAQSSGIRPSHFCLSLSTLSKRREEFRVVPGGKG